MNKHLIRDEPQDYDLIHVERNTLVTQWLNSDFTSKLFKQIAKRSHRYD